MPSAIQRLTNFRVPENDALSQKFKEVSAEGAGYPIDFPMFDLKSRPKASDLNLLRNGFEVIELPDVRMDKSRMKESVETAIEKLWFNRTQRRVAALCSHFQERDMTGSWSTMRALPLAHINATDLEAWHKVDDDEITSLKYRAWDFLPWFQQINFTWFDGMVNVWMSVKNTQMEDMPLGLMDTATFDLDKDTRPWQFQPGLTSRLVRYSTRQNWYFDSSLALGKAYVFSTVGHEMPGYDHTFPGTPHGAFMLGDGTASSREGQRHSREIRCPLVALEDVCGMIKGARTVPNQPTKCSCPYLEGLSCNKSTALSRLQGTTPAKFRHSHRIFDAYKVLKKYVHRECSCKTL
jgi:hypothetical protein